MLKLLCRISKNLYNATLYYLRQYFSSYPDSYYRGPSMGLDYVDIYYYDYGCKLNFNKTYDEFLKYVEENVEKA